MERSSQNRPSTAMDLSKRNSHLVPSASAVMDSVKHSPWHSQLTRNHNGAAGSDVPLNHRPGPQSLTQGDRSRSLHPYNSRSSLPALDHGVSGGEAAVRRLSTGVKSGTDGGGGVHGRGLEPSAAVNNRERRSDPGRTSSQDLAARDQFHMDLRATGGSCGLMYDPDPDELSESPSPESSESDSDVIFLVSSTREDALVPQEDSPSPCSSLDQDRASSEDRDVVSRSPLTGALPAAATAATAATTSPDKGRGRFLLPRPHSSLSPDSSDSEDASSESTGEILPQASLLLMSELTAAYSNCASSPVGISSDNNDDDSSSDDVVEVPVTNERSRASPSFANLEAYNQRLIMQQQQQPRITPHGGARWSTTVRTPSRPAPKPKPRPPPKPALPPEPPPTRTLYRRQAKVVSLNLDETYDSGDMMNSTDKQSSSEEEEEEEDSNDSDAICRMVSKTTPTAGCSPIDSKPIFRGLAPAAADARYRPILPPPVTSTPTQVNRQTQQQTNPMSSSAGRKRLMEREPCQRPAPLLAPAPAANQPAKNVRAPVSKPPSGETKLPPAPTRRRRKRAKQDYGPGDLMLSPRELEIQQKYARCRPERRENKLDDFCPFVYVRRRVCTVVNCPEEEQSVRGGKRRDRHGGAATVSLPGCVPRTSCHQLGRVSSRTEASQGGPEACQSRTETTQFCCLCGGLANAMALGDLHGPYYLVDDRNGPRDQSRHWNHDEPPSERRLLQPPVTENGFHSGLTNGYGHGGNEAGNHEMERGIKEERSIIEGERGIKEERRIKQEVEQDRGVLRERMEEDDDEVVVISDDEEGSTVPSAKPPWTDGLVDEGPESPTIPPHSPESSTIPPHSPELSTMPPHSPDPPTISLHSPGHSATHPCSPIPSGMPSHSPGPLDMPAHNTSHSAIPLHSPGSLTSPSHSCDPPTISPHSPGYSAALPCSPGPPGMPPHSPVSPALPPHSSVPPALPPHSPVPPALPPHSPGPPHSLPPLCSSGERWVHEDCGIWSAGLFLVKGRLYGLEEAIWLARETVCTTCNTAGAIMGCFMKGCPTKYHYRCAVQSGCALNEENFSMRCPKHKNKSFRGVNRLHDR